MNKEHVDLREQAEEAEIAAWNEEAQAWEEWKKNWKPSFWDRIYIRLRQPEQCYNNYHCDHLRRERFLKHRQKSDVPR